MNKTLLALAATAGIAIGGFTAVNAVSAQGYDANPTSTTATQEATTDTAATPTQAIQDVPDASAEAGDQAGPRGHGGGCDLDTAAETIGIDVEDLRSALDEGQTIAEVATANDVDPQAVIDAQVAEASQHLSDKVEAGDLTQEEADVRLAEKTERITDRVNNGKTEGERPEGDHPKGERPQNDAPADEAPDA